MNGLHKKIRAAFSSMSPRRAEECIRAFHLPEEEEIFLIECDVRGLSYAQAAYKYYTTPEVIKRRRQRAYSKIADEIKQIKEESRGW